jgi:hypothetical protein
MENYYKNLDKKFIVDNSFDIEIPMNINWKSIGINLSGGADSALLTWIICKLIKKHNLDTRIKIITFNRNYKLKPWQDFYSLQVYKYFKDNYPDIILDRITTFIPPELEHREVAELLNGKSGDQIIVNSFNRYLVDTKQVEAVFNATTKNPPIEGGMPQRYIKELKYEDLVNNELTEFDPFKGTTKDLIVLLYKSNNLQELFDLTRSCEVTIDKLGLDSYTEGTPIPICNECWWCKERNWAIKVADQMEKGYDYESR